MAKIKYVQAKQVALGLQVDNISTAPPPNMWDVSPKSVRSQITEMPFQFFDKSLMPPAEVLAHKTALALFDEYPLDRKRALSNLQALSNAIRQNLPQVLARLLKRNPAAEWLSFIFLEPNDLQTLLWEPILEASVECRSIILSALAEELKRLKAYTELLNGITMRLGQLR
jgi:hypothetical protein